MERRLRKRNALSTVLLLNVLEKTIKKIPKVTVM
jgi:hypothetical protein